jgi:hypothetical protein
MKSDQEVILITGGLESGSLRNIRQELERQQSEVTKKILDSKMSADK